MPSRFAVLFLAVLGAMAQQTPGTLSGIVVDSAGVPINDARLRLVDEDGRQTNLGQSTSTHANGAFRFAGVKPGHYFLTVSHHQNPGPLGGPQIGIRVEMKPGQETEGLKLTFSAPTVVSGRVLNDEGEPVGDCHVFISPVAVQEGSASRLHMAVTGHRGFFRIDSVAPDRYVAFTRCNAILPTEHLLDAVPRNGFEARSMWMPVFYPDSPTRAGAQPFAAAPGLDPHLEFHLRATPVNSLTGPFSAAPGVRWQEPVSMEIYPADAGEERRFASISGNSDEEIGSFLFQMAPPGTYRLVATTRDRGATPPATANFPLIVGSAAPAPFPIVLRPGIPVSGIAEDSLGSRLIQPGSNVSYVVENTPTGAVRHTVVHPAGTTTLDSADAGSELFATSADIDSETGRFTLPAVPAGRWRVRCRLKYDRTYVESVIFNDKRMECGVIEIRGAPAPALRIRLAPKPNVTYKLTNQPADPEKKWMVLAIPEQPLLTEQDDNVAEGDPESLKYASRIVPGRYRFIALEPDFAGSRDHAPLLRVLAPKVDPIEVQPTGGQTIPVRCFTKAEVEKAITTYLYGDTPPPSAP
ncbi:carboxypeptidase-like regulatory domain-containing protein [Paludibaculum fermentans]|uniref:Carboxypeptidase regulatory-like domain-containing protein n=1 Tax=Paludibaculum fermentans TaxID=1473598 RepID=A0A7S7NQZ6_PALFE|nr:carboxypeptidase-like regulatory domain-containing protein [Paludibaculum fermentans]QOY88099.1 carboxypeptidase regulatory-like domain-containing protein [Paludibaculum fermentans]